MKIAVILPAAGSGKRLAREKNKILLVCRGKPVLGHSLCLFDTVPAVAEIIVVAAPGEEAACKTMGEAYCSETPVTVVTGGKERMDSVFRGLKAVSKTCDTVLIHDAARPFLRRELLDTLLDCDFTDGAILALPVKDTIKAVSDGIVDATPDRKMLYRAQTPQIFPKERLVRSYEQCINSAFSATDDASVVEACGGKIKIVPGDEDNIKITTPQDWRIAVQEHNVPMLRVGSGFDVHCLTENRPLILGGVTIPFTKGLLGHSDADVVTHALMDAVLGALGKGDIGRHFPPSDPRYKDADSLGLLERIKLIMEENHYELVNADITIMAERPKMAPHIAAMRENLAAALKVGAERISVKATTTETLGFVGREEGIAASASVLVQFLK